MKHKEYLVAHIRDALAASPAVGALDLMVDIVDDTVYLSGMVDSEAKRTAASVAAARAAPGYRIVNSLTIMNLLPVEAAEVLNDTLGSHR